MVTTRWGSGRQDADFALRQIAAAASVRLGAPGAPISREDPAPRLGSIVVLDRSLSDDHPGPIGPEADGAFDIHRLNPRTSDFQSEPQDQSAQVRWAWVPLLGSGTPAPEHLEDPAKAWLCSGAAIGSDRLEPGYLPGQAPDQAPSVILVTSEYEASLAHHLVAARSAEIPIINVALSLAINPLALESAPLGLGISDYLLVLAAWPGPEPRHQAPVASYLHRQVAALTPNGDRSHTTIIVEAGGLRIEENDAVRYKLGSPGRTDLWRLMAGARLVVDLRVPPYLGRETLEALLIGTPVVVTSTGAAADYANAGGGTFSTKAELVDATVSLWTHASRRGAASRAGRAWAAQHYGDRNRFMTGVAQALREI